MIGATIRYALDEDQRAVVDSANVMADARE